MIASFILRMCQLQLQLQLSSKAHLSIYPSIYLSTTERRDIRTPFLPHGHIPRRHTLSLSSPLQLTPDGSAPAPLSVRSVPRSQPTLDTHPRPNLHPLLTAWGSAGVLACEKLTADRLSSAGADDTACSLACGKRRGWYSEAGLKTARLVLAN